MNNNLTKDELEFVKKALPGRLSIGLMGVVAMLGAPLLIWIATRAEKTFGMIFFGVLGVLGFVFGVLMIRTAMKNFKNPVFEAIESNPSQLTGLRLQGLGVSGLKSESTYVYVRLKDGGEYPIFCNKAGKKDELVRILLKAAPQLAGNE